MTSYNDVRLEQAGNLTYHELCSQEKKKSAHAQKNIM